MKKILKTDRPKPNIGSLFEKYISTLLRTKHIKTLIKTKKPFKFNDIQMGGPFTFYNLATKATAK